MIKGSGSGYQGILEFLAEVGSEASDAESLRFEEATGGEATKEATSGAGKAPVEKEEEEAKEEEEKDPDVYFKRNR